MTNAAAFFDRCRGAQADGETSADDAPDAPHIRPLHAGLLARRRAKRRAGRSLPRIGCAVAGRRDGRRAGAKRPFPIRRASWPRSSPRTTRAEPLRGEVAARAAEAGISLDGVVVALQTRLAEQMGNDRESYLIEVLEELVNNFAPKRSFVTRMPPGKVIVEALDGIVRRQGAEDAAASAWSRRWTPPCKRF